MAKTATLKAKNFLGKDFTIMDSMANIKKINAGIKELYKRINEVDEKEDNPLFADYNTVITEEVVKQTAKLLNLTKEDTKKLESMSYADISDFYSTAVDSFTGMAVPNVREMQEQQKKAVEALSQQDPKQSSEN
ncbi:MAG: hypothetical protein ACLRX6_03145 [Limosilactobacillus pontis]|uniref:hypothetical protein n=1 Tax=Limosilactobacillus pontis TaxID=35787 RepID=UPI0039A11B6C